ncbi:hypothetical protein PMI42_07684 [Bradyrhizobium sp. YR681]|uniref:hypothetical protein n=1 Tax=Bradyrhizobium sp. YR681 TaxID=1144344 RepID=UPI00026FA0B4|nr:hypothetical protein [Bradyrhizobium sp. YR681]EJN07669.1 hypothetical protein PMI42_07684 [Bradyrhizobium sp. YR681]
MTPNDGSLLGRTKNALSKIDRIYDYLEAPPRAANAKTFHLLAVLGQSIMKTKLGAYISKFGRAGYPLALTALAPAVPRGVNQIVARTMTSRPFWFWFFTAMFFCLVLNAAFTCGAGTFTPPGRALSSFCAADPNSADPGEHLYFTQDVYNIVLYLLVVPAYVAFDITIIKLFVTTWPDFKRFADTAGASASDASADLLPTSTNKRIASYFIVVTLVVVVFITGYINDILKPGALVRPAYWFVRTTGSGDRVLNSVGAYYLIMNAALLFLTVSALWCYIAISMEIARYAKNVGPAQANDKDYSLKKDAHVLLFSQALVYMKILVAVYAINIFIWSQSPLGVVNNALVSLIALLLVMTVFIPAPRIYLEYRWHAMRSFSNDGYEDTRSTREKWTTRALDWLVFALLVFIAEQRFPGFFKSLHDTAIWLRDTAMAPVNYLGNLVLQIFPAS